MMKRVLWILTEERAKVEIIEKIIEEYANVKHTVLKTWNSHYQPIARQKEIPS